MDSSCDDAFEEHTGLHLHSLNASSGPFETLSYTAVDAFAEDWGFIRTASITLNSTDDVRAFTSRGGETGKWHFKSGTARPSRTSSCAHTSPTRPRRRKGSWNRTVSREQSPYTPRSDFFFKVKFDEPYMMYCDWRGVTRVPTGYFSPYATTYKQGAAKMGLSVLPKSKR
ncbi:hypothetical protein D9611_011456 [Ephemerocybe angulata]|uniref:T4 RNA ligase 1-like N-terminal domain-containing protein n=1 Tax=Ephemerocybe angulata TaxID=980116 RepID=A0A8H5CFI2_9AGAR|nr:hypothetical protein D9611_011456 [Tulosesus angulatus]